MPPRQDHAVRSSNNFPLWVVQWSSIAHLVSVDFMFIGSDLFIDGYHQSNVGL